MPQKGFTSTVLIFGIVIVASSVIGGVFLVNQFSNKSSELSDKKVATVYNKVSPLPIQSSMPTLVSKSEKVASSPESCAKQRSPSSPTSNSSESGMTLEEAKRIMPLYPAEVITKVKEGKVSIRWPGTGEGGSGYLVCRRTSESSEWQVLDEVKIVEDNKGDYSFEDVSVKANFSYIYGIRFVDIYENYSQIMESSLIIVP